MAQLGLGQLPLSEPMVGDACKLENKTNYLVVFQNRGPQCKPKNAIIFMMGIPKKVP